MLLPLSYSVIHNEIYFIFERLAEFLPEIKLLKFDISNDFYPKEEEIMSFLNCDKLDSFHILHVSHFESKSYYKVDFLNKSIHLEIYSECFFEKFYE